MTREGAADTPRTKLRATLFVLVAGAAFATSGPVARWARSTPPLVLALGRLGVAALVMLVWKRREIAAALRGLNPRDAPKVALAGALLGAHFACFQWGLEHTSLAAAVSLVSLEPLSVVLVAWAAFGLVPTRAEGLGIVVATAGALIVGSAAGEGEHRVAGDIAVLVAVALYGGYLAFARGLKDLLPPTSYAALVYTAAAVSLALVVPWTDGASAVAISAEGLFAITLLALVPTMIGHTAVQAASRTLSPSIVALVSPGETVGAIAIGALILGETPTGRELAGALVVLVGAAIALRGRST